MSASYVPSTFEKHTHKIDTFEINVNTFKPFQQFWLLIPCNHHSLSLPAPIGILIESLGKELLRPSAYIVVKAFPTLPKACQIINRKQKLAEQPFNKGSLPRFLFCWTGIKVMLNLPSPPNHSIQTSVFKIVTERVHFHRKHTFISLDMFGKDFIPLFQPPPRLLF